MSQQFIISRPKVSKKLFGAFFTILALFVQPLVALNIPSAFAVEEPAAIVITSPNANGQVVKTGDTFTATYNKPLTGTDTGRFEVFLTSACSGNPFRSTIATNNGDGTLSAKSADVSANGLVNAKCIRLTVYNNAQNTNANSVLARSQNVPFTFVNPDTTAPTIPVATPAGGSYKTAQSVSLSSTDNSGNAPSIYYTTDGSTPSKTSTQYTAPIAVNTTQTIKAIAYDNANNQSAVTTEQYNIRIPASAPAKTTVIVTPDTAAGLGWTTSDTRSNGSVGFVADNAAPLGNGALSLKTDNTPTSGQDKAQYYNYEYFTNPFALYDVSGDLGYSTKQNSASFVAGLPSYQIPVYLQNTAGTDTFATLTYEPYVDKGNSAVQTNTWQTWNIDRTTSKFYVSKNVTNTNGSVVASQGSSTYTLDQINEIFPDAKVLGYGVNIGSNNPGYDTTVDAFTFNNKTFDFNPTPVDTEAPAVPSNLTVKAQETGAVIASNSTTRTKDVTVSWTGSVDADHYVYKIWDNIAGTTYNGEANAYTTNVIGTSRDGEFNQGDGTYYIQVAAVDAAGNASAFSAQYVVTYDGTSPTVAITSPSANQILRTVNTSNKLTISGTAKDDSNFNYYYCYVSKTGGPEVGSRDAKCETAWATGTPSKTAFADSANGTTNGTLGSVDLSGIADGNYTVHVVAKDKVGNTTEATQDFVLDNTKPTVSLLTPTVSSVNPTQIVLNANDATALNKLTANIYDETNTTLIKSCSKTATSLNTDTLTCSAPNLSDGTYTIRANASDKAGNVSQTITRQFTVDRTGPVISLVAPAQASDLQRAQSSIKVKFSDTVGLDDILSVNVLSQDGTPLANTSYFVGFGFGLSTGPLADANVSFDAATGIYTIDFDSTNFPDGIYDIQAVAKDTAGNETDKTFDNSMEIDNTAPLITTNISNGDLLSGAKDVTMTLTGEAHPKIYNIRVLTTDNQVAKDTNGNNVAGYYNANNTSNSASFTFDTTKVANGSYKLQFSAKDAAGNTATTIFRTVTVSNTVTPPAPLTPVVVVNQTAPNGLLTGTVTNAPNVKFSQDGFEINGVRRNDLISSIVIATQPNVDGTYNFSLQLTAEYVPNTYSVKLRAENTGINNNQSDEHLTDVVVTSNESGSGNNGGGGNPPVNPTEDIEDAPSANNAPLITSNPNATGTIASLQNARNLTGANQTGSDTAVLGATDTEGDTPSVLGAQDKAGKDNFAAISTSENGWKIFGLAWYWWLAILAAIAAAWWFIAGYRRRNSEQA